MNRKMRRAEKSLTPRLSASVHALPSDYVKIHFDGRTHHEAQRFAEAEACYRLVLDRFPDHPDTLHLLGNIAAQFGHIDQAIAMIEKAISLDSKVADYPNALGHIYRRLGRPQQALAYYAKATSLNQKSGEAPFLAAISAAQMGNFDVALVFFIDALRREPTHRDYVAPFLQSLDYFGAYASLAEAGLLALVLDPSYAEALRLIGKALILTQRTPAALCFLLWAVAVEFDDAPSQGSLGLAYAQTGLVARAVKHFELAVKFEPLNGLTYANLANAYSNLGRPENGLSTAIRSYVLEPAADVTLIALTNAALAMGYVNDAFKFGSRGLSINPLNTVQLSATASVMAKRNQLFDAICLLRRALALKPDFHDGASNLGGMLLSAGMPELAAEVYRRIAVVAPSNLTAAQNHAFLANYSDGLSSEEIFDIHRQTARAIERAYAQSKLPSVESRPVEHAGRRRVGFLSADLRAHPVGYFAFPILESISKDHFELFFYSTSGGRDWLNEKIRAIADHWVDCETFDHEALIECIAADGLDVLIDLSGHSAGNRLFLMTGQLAPVQASWVGYFNTTGLRAVQYQIMDHATVPPSEERWFSETVLKLNRSRFGYIPPPYSPDVAPTPALANGYVTFGSFNNIAKYSETTLQIWAQILDRLPTARLILKWGALSDAPIRAALVNRWQRAGGDLNRLEIRVGSPHAEMLAEYGDIDIALDPTPFCGGLTTAEALWMGVPVISLVGQRPVARQGFALLRAAHLDQCAALDAEDYISKAIAMATKLNDLQALRLNMRTQLMASPLMDGPGLARDFEEVLQMMKPTRLHSLTTGAVSR